MELINGIRHFLARKAVKFAGKRFVLFLDDRHEKKYYEIIEQGTPDFDNLIAAKFIKPGDIVLDAGANIGFSTLLFIKNGASKVYAFEPVPTLYKRLSGLRGNNIITFNIALSDRNSNGEIILSSSHNQGHTLNPTFLDIFPSVFGSNPARCKIGEAMFDDLLGHVKFDFFKIDIEGSELSFLKGAKKSLEKQPPRIMQIEIYPEMFMEVNQKALNYFKYVKRAVIDLRTNALCLIDIVDKNEMSNAAYRMGPPIYLYFNDADLAS